MAVNALIVAAGTSERFAASGSKQLSKIAGKPLISYSIDFFLSLDCISSLLITVAREIKSDVEALIERMAPGRRIDVMLGGATRQDSVFQGLKSLPSDTDVVCIHDGARPFPPRTATLESIVIARTSGAAIVALPARDTVKASREDSTVDRTLSREDIWLAQTPQTFQYELILRAYERVAEERLHITDDAQAVEQSGGTVMLVKGHPHNMKITFLEDIVMAESILATGKLANH